MNCVAKKRAPLTGPQDEARRRLIRYTTALNTATVHGNCLVVLAMLAGRDVIYTHKTWRLMMKFAVWRAFECMRAMRGLEQAEPDVVHRLDLIGEVKAGGTLHAPLSNYYEDYLH